MSDFAPLSRRSLHNELLDRLREMIVGAQLLPGAKVPEKLLCEQFKVSRTPLREALRVLAAEGLIIQEPHKGSIVAPIVLEDLEEAIPVMAALERLSGRLACRSMTDEKIAGVRALHERMRQCYVNGRQPEYFALNRQIHEAILEGAANQLLSLHHGQVSKRIRRARSLAALSADLWEKSMQDHEEIIVRLEARDEAALPDLLEAHMMSMLAHYRKLPRAKR
ncbi:MAG: GntR family transcriptional regulator [Hyphomicrobiales bacterium]|nr:GntR family transcriptional regulator [Hyphomicrobiales bacterium]